MEGIRKIIERLGLENGSLIDLLSLITQIMIFVFLPIMAFALNKVFFRDKKEPISSYPTKLDSNFIGRKNEVKRVNRKFKNIKFLGKAKNVVLVGMGGIGKTSIALKYIEKNRNRYGHVVWIDSDTNDTIRESLVKAQATLSQSGYQQYSGGGHLELRALKKNKRTTLIVLDNLDTPPIGIDLIGQVRNSHTLITSRFVSWGKDYETIEVGQLPLAEAVLFLKSVTGLTSTIKAQIVAKKLGCLPLALNHAAYTILETPNLDFDQYLTRFNDIIKYVPKHSNYPRSIHATFQLALESCGVKDVKNNKSLYPLAFLSPDNISLEILILLQRELGVDIDSKFFLENLQKRSVIKQSKQDGNYKIHRVVQTVIRSSMSNEQIVEFSKSLFSVAEKIIPSTTVDFQAYKKAQVILDGIDYISSLELPISVEIASLLLISGSANLQWGSDKLAEKHLKLAQKFKPQNPDEQLLHARIKSSEGWLLGNQHKYHEAIIAFKSTIIDLENMAGTPNNAENVILSQVYNNMGRAYQFLAQRENDKSQFPLASEALKKSLKLVKSIYGELSTDYGQKLNNIAMLHLAMGKNQQALLEITQARNITQTVLGNENPTLGIRLRNLAHIQHFNSLDMEALPNIRKAWDLLESPNKDKPDRRTVVLVTYALVSKGISEKEYSDACQKLYDILIIEKFNIGQDAMNILVSYLQNSKQIILLAKVYFLRFYKGYGKKSLQT